MQDVMECIMIHRDCESIFKLTPVLGSAKCFKSPLPDIVLFKSSWVLTLPGGLACLDHISS